MSPSGTDQSVVRMMPKVNHTFLLLIVVSGGGGGRGGGQTDCVVEMLQHGDVSAQQ